MKFSAVIPLYNGGPTLGATLDAVLAQHHPAHEIIVVDDASTDQGPAIAARYGDRIKLMRREQNAGVQMARNFGVEHASGDWIAFCDQDDLWSPEYLSRNAALLAAVPDLELIFTNFQRLIDGKLEDRSKFAQAPSGFWEQAGRRVLPEGWVFERPIAGLTFGWHPVFPSATIVSRRLIDAVGGFNPAMRGLRPEDGEFTLRCLYRAKVGAIPDPEVTIRRHATNFSRDQVMTLVDEVAALQFVRAHHEEARQFWPVIDAEIRQRRILAAHGAFAQGNHKLLRQLLSDIGPVDRNGILRAKAMVASLPAPLDGWANTGLQGLSGALRNLLRLRR
ncbi:MAG: glycosyltransferase family A protein [Acetobacteraceae bacterium]